MHRTPTQIRGCVLVPRTQLVLKYDFWQLEYLFWRPKKKTWGPPGPKIFFLKVEHCTRIPVGLRKLVGLADLEGGVHEAFFLFLLTPQIHFAIISGQH